MSKKTQLSQSFSAIPISYNDITFYMTVLPSKILFDTSKVSRADEDKERGYQRLLGSKRAKDIARYINEGNVIPGAIILSAQKEAKLQFDHKSNRLTYYLVPNAFIVIDGQHRLYGTHQSEQDIPLAVCIFENLDLEEEVQYFLDINSTQRSVPKTLQLELTKFIAKPESKDEVRQRLFNELNEQPTSPLSGRMSPTKSVSGKLSHVSFKDAINPLLETALFKKIDFEDKTKMLINFLSAVEDVLIESEGSSKRLTMAVFFKALFGAFDDICDLVMMKFGNYQKESFLDIVEPIGGIDWERYKGTNKQVINALTEELKTQVASRAELPSGLF
ncbi:MAG: DGQHR domain-containing protein [Pseudomonadota bacterium]